MCIGDWRIGRLITTQMTRFNTAGASKTTYNQNRQRVGFGVYIDIGIDISINANESGGPLPAAVTIAGDLTDLTGLKISVNGNAGIRVNYMKPEWMITLETHGSLPMQKFVLTADQNDITGLVIEYFMPEEYLSACLEQFQSEYKPWLKSP